MNRNLAGSEGSDELSSRERHRHRSLVASFIRPTQLEVTSPLLSSPLLSSPLLSSRWPASQTKDAECPGIAEVDSGVEVLRVGQLERVHQRAVEFEREKSGGRDAHSIRLPLLNAVFAPRYVAWELLIEMVLVSTCK